MVEKLQKYTEALQGLERLEAVASGEGRTLVRDVLTRLAAGAGTILFGGGTMADGGKPEREKTKDGRARYLHGKRGGRTPEVERALSWLSKRYNVEAIASAVGVGQSAVSMWLYGGGMSKINAERVLGFARVEGWNDEEI